MATARSTPSARSYAVSTVTVAGAAPAETHASSASRASSSASPGVPPFRTASARTSDTAAPIEDSTSACSGRTSGRPSFAATAGTSAAPAPPSATSGTSSGRACCDAASETAFAICSTAPSRIRRAASLGRRPQPLGKRPEREQRRLLRRARVVALLDEPERVRCARHGQREALAARLDAGIALGVAGTGRDELELGVLQLGRICEAGVRKARDVGAARADLRDASASEQRHAAARGADDPAVDGANARGTSHHAERTHDGTAAAHDRDVRARAAALDHDRVAEPELVQRRRDSGRGAGADREGRPFAEGVDAHRAAVAAQHEERHVDARVGQGAPYDAGRALDDRQDAGVDCGADRARLEPVGAAQLVAGAGGEARVAHAGGREVLVLRVVDRQRAAHRDRRAAGGGERGHGRLDVHPPEAAGRVHECVLRLEPPAGRERNVADPCPLAGAAEVRRGADPEHADPADVALEQRVHRLRGGEGDERDAPPVVTELVEEPGERARDPLGDAAWSAPCEVGTTVCARRVAARSRSPRPS